MNTDAAIRHSDKMGIRTITIDKPERRNALDQSMREAFADIVCDGHADAAVRAMIITGSGSTFCSGADVSSFQRHAESTAARERMASAQNISRTIAGGGTPVVAAVEGMAFGLGLGMALACDFIIAAASAKFSAAFIDIGLSADVGVLFTLPQRVGIARARVMLMRGETLNAVEAATIGLVDELAPEGSAAGHARQVAELLVDRPPLVIAAMKAAFRQPPNSLADSLDLEVDLQIPLLGSADFAEAVASFREKRQPQFTGA